MRSLPSARSSPRWIENGSRKKKKIPIEKEEAIRKTPRWAIPHDFEWHTLAQHVIKVHRLLLLLPLRLFLSYAHHSSTQKDQSAFVYAQQVPREQSRYGTITHIAFFTARHGNYYSTQNLINSRPNERIAHYWNHNIRDIIEAAGPCEIDGYASNLSRRIYTLYLFIYCCV